MSETPRLLFVHAHPDDESLSNGATIAHYTSRGAQVHVVTCTLGEEGEVIGDRWAQLTADHADQLGGYRIGELTAALRALGVSAPIYLGGAGRWRDSGMAGTDQRSQRRFVDADPRQTVGALVAIIRELRPHVVVTYDPNGGYGHPDHVHTHTVTTAAVAAAGVGSGTADHPGDPVDGAEVLLDGLGSERAHFGRASPGPRRSATRMGVAAGRRDCIRVLRRRYRRRRRGR
ncbi:N-Acetyl-1-D-myo-Inosityl-2-amino-2-deoxy-alpha [Mycobacterium tuberculosis T85]|nr:N-Acetyl-1-D-myo-Inosityl-2-amino-2-deoxy-alpha [Mycobacterium tuberculosis T85]